MSQKQSKNPDGTWNQSVPYTKSEQKQNTTTIIDSPDKKKQLQQEKWYKEGDMSHFNNVPPKDGTEALARIVRDQIQKHTGYQAGQKFPYENGQYSCIALRYHLINAYQSDNCLFTCGYESLSFHNTLIRSFSWSIPENSHGHIDYSHYHSLGASCSTQSSVLL